MIRRLLSLATALTIGHVIVVAFWGGVHLGVARGARDLSDRNPLSLRIVIAAGDVLMFPTSVVWWLWRGERFPDSTGALLLTSPIWGFGVAYLLKRDRQGSEN